ncbi:hypothetical protein STAS_25250 [Striga asiatica]|uniref:mRNA decay factor PAT1 domain-containing protein n=1 Tax=Striga asiatica TaxID=4170 RepID=A0A5A7QS77_STRAF|nr:hypothetical protein STAS_25250 [Striga asiatica]
MDGCRGEGSIGASSKLQGLIPVGANPTGDALFDASQYEFFGGNVLEEVELGGLEDGEDDLAPAGFEEEEFQFDKEEADGLGSLSKIDDLSSTFSKLNKVDGGPTSAGVISDSGSKESSSAAELAHGLHLGNSPDQRAFDAETLHDSKNWSSHHPYSVPRFVGPDLLHRTSSYPHQEQQKLQHHHSTEPILIPNSPFTSYPPPGGRSQQASPNGLSNIPHHPKFVGPTISSISNSTQLPQGLPLHNSQHQNQWANQTSLLSPRNHLNFPNNFPGQNRFPQMMPPQQTLTPHRVHPHIPHLQAQLLPRSSHPALRYPHNGPHGPPRFKSKYMTAGEIENIHRMQLMATHNNDPYVDDYYHQAILARKSRHHFCPSNLREEEDSSNPHPSNEPPHPFLQVDALGRVSFSSIRRPRPLLEIENPSNSPNNNNPESKITKKPLEQEPMLAARAAIEDGIRLLLDVNDIDRFLQFNELPDGGAQLRQRRQVLLEAVASSSFHLVDPLAKNGHTVSLSRGRDDSVFLQLVSLPKGKKLLTRYLELLNHHPGELARVVCMAVCRNLRFLFGNTPTNCEMSIITRNLADAVSNCVIRIELKALAACLGSVVCSPEDEQPPLRPVGHSSGDGASLVLKSVLDRATELMTGPRAAENCSDRHRAFWQVSFDAFFEVLAKYCFGKYDIIVQSRGAGNNGGDLGNAIGREIPVEVLRACLPHTNERQRKLLLEFARRSVYATGFNGGS